MDDDKIEEILKKQEETLLLVKKLWRAEKMRRFWTIAKYVIFLGIILGAFYFLTPYIEKFISLTQGFQNIKNPQDLQKFLEQLK
ncbi:MAG: hypothetical protein Q8N43_02370 [Candidatus Azambacteria bacterium]|nr:hypothetical protein [Candidatus Azambacteria bacterium]